MGITFPATAAWLTANAATAAAVGGTAAAATSIGATAYGAMNQPKSPGAPPPLPAGAAPATIANPAIASIAQSQRSKAAAADAMAGQQNIDTAGAPNTAKSTLLGPS